MNTSDGLVAQSLVLHVLEPLDPPAGTHLIVEFLNVQRGQLFQRDFPDGRHNVVVNIVLVVECCGLPDIRLGVYFKPDLRPLSNGVLFILLNIQILCGLDGLFQLLLYLSLGFPQHVAGDSFAGVRVESGGVAAFPAAVLAFADVAFSVCSAFCHV